MAERELTLEERTEREAISAANNWERLAYGASPVSDADTAVNPCVAAQVARDLLKEAGLPGKAAEIVTPKVNYQQ